MELVAIVSTTIATLIVERVATKVYLELSERRRDRIEDKTYGFSYGKYLNNIGCSYGVKRKLFESDRHYKARILEKTKGYKI